MSTPLSQLSNEELWQLFPIILSDHQPDWKDFYLSEKKVLQQLIGSDLVQINHIGSTAVPELIAKPTIDMLMQIKEETNLPQLISTIESLGYIYSEQPGNPPPHMVFMKGYTPKGFKGQAFHLHVRYPGDWNELYFCHYLQVHPEVAKAYGELKIRLKKQYEHNRDGYTEAKSDFIRKATEQARQEFHISPEKNYQGM